MNRYVTFLLLVLLFCICGCRSGSMDKPNIIFIMADDLGYGDLGCYGATKIKTPYIDRLAKNGIKLLDAHSPASVCSPTRYGVLTGRYAWRGRLKKEVLWSGYDRCQIEPDRKTIGNMMQEKGYKTAYVGKWHLGWGDIEPVDYDTLLLGRGPRELGFDFSFVTAAAHNLSPITFVEDHMVMSKLVPLEHDIYDSDQGLPMPENQVAWHRTHDLGPPMIAENWQPELVDQISLQRAIDFISRHVMTDSIHPFYLHLTPEAPHRPNNVPVFMQKKSEAGSRGDHIQMLDWMVGQIMTTLMELKIDKKTLVILTSDNGPTPAGLDGYENGRLETDFGHQSAGCLRGFKASLWEGGHRVPFIAHWPDRIKPGTTSDKLICLTDIMATFASIIDFELEDNMGEDSFNALPLLLGRQDEIRESIIHQDYHGNLSIRKGFWKLVDGQLFDLDEDPGENHDLAGENPDVVDNLKTLLQDQLEGGRTAFH